MPDRHVGRWLAVLVLTVIASGGPLAAPAGGQPPPAPPLTAPTTDEEVVRWMRRYLERPPAKRAWPQLYPDFPAAQAAQAPAALRLMAADHYLRSGHARVASKLFLDVFETTQGTPLESLAMLGLAWSAVGSGDRSMAVALLEDGTARNLEMPRLTAILLALLQGSDGHYPEAETLLDQTLARGDLSPPQETVARLARAYVRYWSGDVHGAGLAFDAVAASDAAAPELDDDARYGAAWSRYQGGDRDGGIAALRELAATTDGTRGRHRCDGSWELVQLTPRAVMQESFRRYRRYSPALPDVAIVRLLDMDGIARACAALRFIEHPPAPAAPGATVPADMPVTYAAPAEPAETRRPAPDAPAPYRAVPADERPRGRAVVVALLVVLALTLVVATWRRGRPR